MRPLSLAPFFLAPVVALAGCAAQPQPSSGAPQTPASKAAEPAAPAAAPPPPAEEWAQPPAGQAAPGAAPAPQTESAPSKRQAPSATTPTAPTAIAPSIEQALAELDRAEREIAQVMPAPGPARDKAARPAPAAPPRAGSGASNVDRAETKEPGQIGAGGCAIACRAFASMQRAADAVCRATGEADGRCSSARARVAASAARVATCGCTG